MDTKRTYAIIGCGMMGREHMQNIALVDDAELIAIVDPDLGSREEAEALGKTLGQEFQLFENADAMFADMKPDAVIVASPNFTHFEVARRAMAHDVAILLEKPFCTDTDDAAELEQMAGDYPHVFWVGMEYRYMPPITRFIDRVQAGETGAAKMLYIREHRFPFLAKVGDWNRFNRNTGGTLVEKCCHFFDLMRHTLQDEPVRIFASGGQDVNHLDESYDGKVPDILDNAYVVIDFAKGTRAVLDLCMFAEGAEQQEEIYALGPIGRLDVAIPAATVTWSPRDKSGVVTEDVATPSDALAAGDHHGATYFQLRDFHAALAGETQPKVSAIDGLRAVQMGAAAQQSIATGLPVQLDFKSGGVGNG
ncbi:Gfo/Idh/MocA family oxidoreductase [Pontixanthobacter sp. CEM42]|uniref:Gfo/Idh/MocA family protein n=1 Tax=Pontixanthobacter sp. CEM42 TaxID=2792077 RepID=UPI0032AEDA98